MNTAALREAASKLAQEFRELDQSYGHEEQRRQLCHRLLKLVVGACGYTLPRELVEALEIEMKLDRARKPGKLGYRRKERDKFISAIMAEQRYLKKHGHPASAYAIAKEVSALAHRNGLRGLSHNTVNVWRKDDQYQMFAFPPDLSE